MSDPALLLRAADFAARKHHGQRRKNGDVPYVTHPLGVAHILADEGGVDDATVLAAAVLHDTVEDTGTTFGELEREFGAAIAAIVSEVTDDKTLPKVERKWAQVSHAPALSPAARLVKLADKLHNLRDNLRQPPHGWDADRVRGYFCWSHAVVTAIGPINEGLRAGLEEAFAARLRVGDEAFRAVPADEVERRTVLDAYYEAMACTHD